MTQKRKHTISVVARALTAVLFFCTGLFFVQCASTLAPTGGPRDSFPPKVIYADPNYATTNFTQKRVYIEFNEYVQLKEQQKEFFVSPSMKKKPTVTLRGRGIQIDIHDTLPENTTYALNFGQSIRDNNENNPMNDFRYVFSTGEKIDSMVMSGFTVNGYTADSIGKTFIMFFPAEADSLKATDSLLLKGKPSVIARSQTNGIFIAENLKPIDYKIYALDDKNGNQLYEPGVDRVGFLDSLYNPARLPDFNVWFDTVRRYLVADPQIYIRMFMDDQFRRQNLTSNKRPLQHKIELQFGAANPQIEYLKFEGIDSSQIITEYLTKGRDTIALWLNVPKENLPDTIKGSIRYLKHDSLSVLQPVTQELKLGWKFFESKAVEKERERREKARDEAIKEGKTPVPDPNPFKYKMDGAQTLNPLKNITMVFDYPIASIDTANISLIRVDEDKKMYRARFRIDQDTANLRKWILRTTWSPGQKYELMMPAGVLRNIAGEANDSIKTNINVMHPDEYSTVVVNVKAKSPQSRYVLQLVDQGGNTVLAEERHAKDGKYTFKYISPGTVKLRVVEDINDNGVWDGGNLIERRQPELVNAFISENNEEEIVTKANWEIEVDVNMAEMFAPMTMERLKEQIRSREEALLRKRIKEREKAKARPARNNNQQQQDNNNTGGGFGGGGMGGGMGGMNPLRR